MIGDCPSYIDVQLCREDDGFISTSMYRMAIHTDQYLSSPLINQWQTRRSGENSDDQGHTLSSPGGERVEKKEDCGRIAAKRIPL